MWDLTRARETMVGPGQLNHDEAPPPAPPKLDMNSLNLCVFFFHDPKPHLPLDKYMLV